MHTRFSNCDAFENLHCRCMLSSRSGLFFSMLLLVTEQLDVNSARALPVSSVLSVAHVIDYAGLVTD
jgi:hypothetical protein